MSVLFKKKCNMCNVIERAEITYHALEEIVDNLTKRLSDIHRHDLVGSFVSSHILLIKVEEKKPEKFDADLRVKK